jgi:membrane-bound serine protease (ClpP class)
MVPISMQRSVLVPALLCSLAAAADIETAPVAAPGAGDGNRSPEITLMEIAGPIGPATSDYFRRELARAQQRKASLVILRLDTPGGLDTAMREINQDIIASPVPVVSWVAPAGARAASAGTYIMYASHVAAMSPATTLGAATPVSIGGPGAPDEPAKPKPKKPDSGKGRDAKPQPPLPDTAMERKIVNDAAAYLRGLAQMRGRNADWAEKAVREGASLSAQEALDRKVIDLIADGQDALLKKLNGRKLTVLGRELTLDTAAVRVVEVKPDWRSRLLAVITDPNILPLLMTLGMLGLIYELVNPGFVLPGVLGAICLLLALYAAQVLPVNYAGVALILLGVAFMVAEVFMPSFGALGIGGVIAFVIGAIILVQTDVPGFEVSWPLMIAAGVTYGMVLIGVLGLAMRSRRQPVVSGSEELIGADGEALEDFTGNGPVRVHSEIWNARSAVPVTRGQRVRIKGISGLVLDIEPETREVSKP